MRDPRDRPGERGEPSSSRASPTSKSSAVAPHGFYYAPDPSSQGVCTIGGNVAENSGGAHCLKYGFTVNHVSGPGGVTPTGSTWLGDGEAVPTGYA